MPAPWPSYFSLPEFQLLLYALVAIALGSLAARLLLRFILRITAAGKFPSELAIRAAGPLHYLVPLMALQIILRNYAGSIKLIGSLQHAVSLLVIAGFTWLGLRAVDAIQQFIIVRHPVDITDNLRARKIHTQTKVLVRTLAVLVFTLGLSAMLMTFPSVRQFGTSLLASAGVAGLAIGFAAKPVLGNLIAGLQIALTQPIRLDDVVIIENEWGRIEEITGTYVVVRIWDNRRLVVPLQWIIENPFQNWTRQTATLLGSVFLWVDYSQPLAPLREELKRLCEEVPHLWDGEVCVLQVTDCNERAIQIRALTSSPDSSRAWDLRCHLREHLLHFLSKQYPESLPKLRATINEKHTHEEPTVESHSPSEVERQPPV